MYICIMKNEKDMKISHLVIGKKITLITEHFTQDFNMSSFDSIIKKFDVVTLIGLTKPRKKEKYSNILLNNNFMICKVNYNENAGFEDKHSDVLNYSIQFKKQTI